MSTAIQRNAPWWTRFKWPETASASSGCTFDAPAAEATMHADMAELGAHTLRDIGAPDSMIARAHARRDWERQERDNLRSGIVGGDGACWRHW